ncbi:MAG: HNH endonuclease [Chitinophagaceae bacterium]|nr:HNH endonuclease [Chitinophagaceae bacterium]
MAKRRRIEIEMTDMMMFESNRTCCVCNEPYKAVQIHHIDGNPGNNEYNNLVILCLSCHDKAHIKGGAGRGWTKGELLKYKEDWIRRVKKRKNDADKLASIQSVPNYENSESKEYALYELDYVDPNDGFTLRNYLLKILLVHNAQWKLAKIEFDEPGGVILGITNMLAFYESVLVKLSTFYPKDHFLNKHPQIFFNEQIATRSDFYGFVAHPFGWAGTMERDSALMRTLEDVKNMIGIMGDHLIFNCTSIDLEDLENWGVAWNKCHSKIKNKSKTNDSL